MALAAFQYYQKYYGSVKSKIVHDREVSIFMEKVMKRVYCNILCGKHSFIRGSVTHNVGTVEGKKQF